MQDRAWRGVSFFFTALIVLSFAGLSAAQTAAAPPPAQKKQAAGGGEWPRKVRMGEITVSLDEPLADSLEGTKLKAHGNARLQREGETDSSYATVWYEADVDVNHTQRTVTWTSVNVPNVQIPGAPPARLQRIATRLGPAITRIHLQLPLDDVLASIKLAARLPKTPPKLNTSPPKILVESEPAILVIFDGEPRFKVVEGSRLERALNTPFLVLHDGGANAFYLDGGTTWFRASSPTGPWTKADFVPSEAVQIAQRDRKEGGVSQSEVNQAMQTAEKRVPKILVATEPTELVVSDGPPKWTPVVEGELEVISNSDNDLFRTLPDKQILLVLSGRWYRSGSLEGPWAYVEPDRLPASLRKIPSDSPKASVLAFVPDTAPAKEAIADSSTPRTTAVKRSEAHVTVTYDGEPKFEAIAGTHVEYALNSPDQILRIRGRYYVCDQGVWFTSGSATGPWAVADSIPDEDIEAIPPESPVYNTRYAYVYDSSPDLVYMAYTPAYLGSYPWYGTVVFGTGWFYRPWWGAFYYPRPWTWGFHAMYRPWAGWGWGFGWGPAWAGFRYGFGFGWGARWCGPGGFYRPAFGNVNVNRNVTVNRNVNVTRNVYRSGANTTRTVANRTATAQTAAAKTTTMSKAGAAHTAGTHTATGTHPGGKSPQGHANAGGAKGGKAKAPAHAGGKAGGKKH
ncbi:MAG TPA: hypothetical protein VF376_14325 [Thermoanaerobaculia bacterium]